MVLESLLNKLDKDRNFAIYYCGEVFYYHSAKIVKQKLLGKQVIEISIYDEFATPYFYITVDD